MDEPAAHPDLSSLSHDRSPNPGQSLSHPGSEQRTLGWIALGLAIAALAIQTVGEPAMLAILKGRVLDSRVYDFGFLLIGVVSAVLMIAALVLGVLAIFMQRHRLVPAIAVGAAVAALLADLMGLINRTILSVE